MLATNRSNFIATVLISVVILTQDIACDDIDTLSNLFKYVIIYYYLKNLTYCRLFYSIKYH